MLSEFISNQNIQIKYYVYLSDVFICGVVENGITKRFFNSRGMRYS